MTRVPRRPRGGRVFRVLLYAMTLVLLMPVWAGVRLMQMGFGVVGIVIVAIGFATFLFALRFARREPDPAGDGSYEVTQEHIDYAIWTALAMPFLFAGLFVVLLLTGALNSP